MGFFKERKRKKRASQGQFERIEVAGEKIPVLSFYLFTSREDGERYLELTSAQELEALHFSQVELEVILKDKKLVISAGFSDAFAKGAFKVYKFKVLSLSEYFC